MFEISNQLYPVFGESADEVFDNSCAFNIRRAGREMVDGGSQKIFLPRGSGQSRFAPPSYYYLASKSGVTPSWVIEKLDSARGSTLTH